MACLIIKYCGIAESPTLLLCCEECERVSVNNRLKTEPFFLWRWVIQIGPLRSDAQRMIFPQFLPEFPWSQERILQGVREEKLQRPLDFSQTNYHLNGGFPHVFHCLFHPYREKQLGKNNFHLSGRRLLSLKEIYFQTSYVNKYENRLYIYKYNWKELNKFFPSDSWLTF